MRITGLGGPGAPLHVVLETVCSSAEAPRAVPAGEHRTTTPIDDLSPSRGRSDSVCRRRPIGRLALVRRRRLVGHVYRYTVDEPLIRRERDKCCVGSRCIDRLAVTANHMSFSSSSRSPPDLDSCAPLTFMEINPCEAGSGGPRTYQPVLIDFHRAECR